MTPAEWLNKRVDDDGLWRGSVGELEAFVAETIRKAKLDEAQLWYKNARRMQNQVSWQLKRIAELSKPRSGPSEKPASAKEHE